MRYVAREKGPAKLNDLSFLCYISKMGITLNTRMEKYRTRAISGRSRLVAAPLRNHAKRQFL